MSGAFRERRQGPRAQLPPAAECRLQLRTRVRLLDISLTGVLIASDVELPVGTRAQLRSTVAAASFTPAVEVKRVADSSDRTGARALGATFTRMDDRSKRSLEEFLRKASS